jgi:hypothetical protein
VIEEDLAAFILADETMQAAIGDSLFPVTLPENLAGCACVYQRISGPPEGTLGGEYSTEARFQFSFFSAAYGEAKGAAAALHALFTDFRGPLKDGGDVIECQIADDRDSGFDPVALMYRVDVDVLVKFPE